MIEVLFFWPLVFEYLEPEDLVSVSSVCLAWWRFVFQGRKSTARALHHCQQLHLADTGKQYRNIPLRYFSELTWINLTRTTISSGDFLKLVGTAKHLEMVNIESCSRISEEAIFKAKRFLPCLRRINISFNDQLSVLAVACLCSCSSLRDIRARGIRLQADFSPTWKWTPNSGHWFRGRWLLCGCNRRLVRLWSFLKRFAQFRVKIYSYVRKRFAQIAQGLLRTHFTLFFIVLFWCWKTRNLVSGLCAKTSANDVGCKWRFCHRR